MEFKEMIVDHIRVVTVMETRLDTAIATEFKQQILQLLEAGPPHLILNLNKVCMIDSSVLGIFAVIYKVCARQGEFALCEVSNNVQTLLRMTKLNQVFHCFSTQDEAIAALKDTATTELRVPN